MRRLTTLMLMVGAAITLLSIRSPIDSGGAVIPAWRVEKILSASEDQNLGTTTEFSISNTTGHTVSIEVTFVEQVNVSGAPASCWTQEIRRRPA
jgi:hypothetical protein